jgi:hypothetical protein
MSSDFFALTIGVQDLTGAASRYIKNASGETLHLVTSGGAL